MMRVGMSWLRNFEHFFHSRVIFSEMPGMKGMLRVVRFIGGLRMFSWVLTLKSTRHLSRLTFGKPWSKKIRVKKCASSLNYVSSEHNMCAWCNKVLKIPSFLGWGVCRFPSDVEIGVCRFTVNWGGEFVAKFTTSVYRKPTHTNLYIRWESAHPPNPKTRYF